MKFLTLTEFARILKLHFFTVPLAGNELGAIRTRLTHVHEQDA